MGPRHGHMNHGYLNNAMGMQAPPDGSPIGQVCMIRLLNGDGIAVLVAVAALAGLRVSEHY